MFCLHQFHNFTLYIAFRRDLINSRFGVSYSNFSFLTQTFWKVSIDKYGKTPTFSGGQHFTPFFENPSENPDFGQCSILYFSFISGSLFCCYYGSGKS